MNGFKSFVKLCAVYAVVVACVVRFKTNAFNTELLSEKLLVLGNNLVVRVCSKVVDMPVDVEG